MCGGVNGAKKTVFQTQQDQYTHELTETMAACIGPAEVHIGWGPTGERGKLTTAPILNPEAISN